MATSLACYRPKARPHPCPHMSLALPLDRTAVASGRERRDLEVRSCPWPRAPVKGDKEKGHREAWSVCIP
jgi:hypothetical protein